jgi:tripartite-type tricarboxylate transporter receptor subunit TctC
MKFIIILMIFFFSKAALSKESIELLIASGPGGSVHRYALQIQPILENALNRNVVLNFKPGGNGIIAARELMNTPPGKTSLMIGNFNTPDVWKENLKEHQMIDVRKDIKPVAFLGTIPSMVYSRPNENFKDFRQALDYGKKQKLTMALAANTPNVKLMKDVIQKHSDSQLFITVPFKTGSLGLLSVLGEHVDTGVTVIDVLVTEMKNNRIVPLALIYPNRLKEFLEVATLREMGIIVDNEDRYYNNFFLWSNSTASNDLLNKVKDALFNFLTDKKSEEFRNSLYIQFGKNNIKNPEKYMEELLK